MQGEGPSSLTEPAVQPGPQCSYLLCTSSSSLHQEEPREKSVLDLRRNGEMLMEKELCLAGCGGCGAGGG